MFSVCNVIALPCVCIIGPECKSNGRLMIVLQGFWRVKFVCQTLSSRLCHACQLNPSRFYLRGRHAAIYSRGQGYTKLTAHQMGVHVGIDVPALPVGDWHHLLVPDHLVKDTVLSNCSKQVICSIFTSFCNLQRAAM